MTIQYQKEKLYLTKKLITYSIFFDLYDQCVTQDLLVMNVNTAVLNTALEHVIMWMGAVAVKMDILGIPVTKVNVS